MRGKYRNAFFLLGLAVLAFMVSQLDFEEVRQGVSRAGYWFGAVVLVWFFLYWFNTAAWMLIIRSTAGVRVPFAFLYRITVSGFALNYATPGGLMGGEPYRIMALAPHIGTEKASASVILYAMTHIFSHFWFWLFSVGLYLFLEITESRNLGISGVRELGISWPVATLLASITVFCTAAIWFFLKGYKRGIAATVLRILGYIPLIKRWAAPFLERNREQLHAIDERIASLHNQKRGCFIGAVMLEWTCRVVSSLEIMFVLLVLESAKYDVNGLGILGVLGLSGCLKLYLDSILILAFTSLIANMLFFMPLQMGGREGGFLLSAKGLAMTTSAGVLVALLVRLRELIWTAVGLLLIPAANRQKKGKD